MTKTLSRLTLSELNMSEFAGEYTRRVNGGRMHFPDEFYNISNLNPTLFYESNQGCLILCGEREMKRYKISPIEKYGYSFRDGILFLPHYVWLKTIGAVGDVAIIGAWDQVQIYDSERWRVEKKKDEPIRGLAFDIANTPKPCVITTFRGLEICSLEEWKRLLECTIVGVRSYTLKERIINRSLVAGSRIIEDNSEILGIMNELSQSLK